MVPCSNNGLALPAGKTPTNLRKKTELLSCATTTPTTRKESKLRDLERDKLR